MTVVCALLAAVAACSWLAYAGAYRRHTRLQREYDALWEHAVIVQRERDGLRREIGWYRAEAVQAAEDTANGRFA